MTTRKGRKSLNLTNFLGGRHGRCIQFTINTQGNTFRHHIVECDEEDCMNIVKCIMETYPENFCKKVFKKNAKRI